jgi:hypothetical protein
LQVIRDVFTAQRALRQRVGVGYIHLADKSGRASFLAGAYMSEALMVPVHLDALHCPHDRVIVQASADFSKLPYTDGTRDLNSGVAQISEEIVARPFQDETALLLRGVHLHWALPDALTRGRHRIDDDRQQHRTRFPAVPNRWLVWRRAAGNLAARAWIVESDYVYPDGTGQNAGVAVPFPMAPSRGIYRPFRFLGRVLPAELWQPHDATAEYVETLSAVGFKVADTGYSDPAFATLYPNCHSVFGFYDGEVGTAFPDGLRYDLIGWYADGTQDFMRTLVADAADAGPLAPLDLLKRFAAWTFDAPDGTPLPDRTVCYASIGLRPAAAPAPGEPTLVTIGNTGTEALSAALATRLDAGRRFEIEATLEAAQLAPRLAHRTVDTDARLRDLRHQNGFSAHRGDQLWTIRPVTTGAGTLPADAERSQAQADVEVPLELAGLLAALNVAQQDRDRAATELESARRQVFADWYKYLLCAYPPEDAGDDYPDIDQARAFIAGKGLGQVRELAATIAPGPDTAQSRLQDAYAATASALDALDKRADVLAAKLGYELVPQVAPRFWQPTDPVVALAGPDARATERHGQDGRLRADNMLTCQLVPGTVVDQVLALDQKALLALLQALRSSEAGPDSVAFRDTGGAPWNPFQLEWEVELFPLREQGNIQPQASSYEPGFVTGHYGLSEQGPDLVPSGEWNAVAGAVAVYSGSSILTRTAGERLGRALADHLRQDVLPAYRAAVPGTGDVADVINDVRAWYERTHADTLADQPSRDADTDYVVIRAYQDLLSLDYLAQALGGFNDALLMHRQVKQLPVADPLGFPDYQAFAGTVAAAVGTSNRSAPEPLNDFNPIRNGAVRLLRLRLVDTFGQTRAVPVDRVIPTEPLTMPGNPDLIALPPRLSQPARVVFRWLAADLDQETNDHPSTSPVCGWFLPNHVDTSLMVYDNQGRALGAVDGQANWQPAPGGTGVATAAGIGNVHLRATVVDILALGADFVTQFLAALDGALENIEPETTDQHVDIAVLIGRPIALVRAAVDLELLGLASVHQGWNQFQQDMARTIRETDGFTRVEFPMRLGAFQQLNDGLLGYWTGDDTTFCSPQSGRFPHEKIRTYGDGPLSVPHAVDQPSTVVRMLVDPRGTVHVTSGIQPVKTISIPPAHYAPALAAIEVTFPCFPLLTDTGTVHVSLPVEPGYRWAWVDQEHGAWTEITQAASIGRDDFTGALAARIWDHLVDPHVAWLQPLPGAAVGIRAVSADERATPTLDPQFQALAPSIEGILAPLGDHLLERTATVARLADVVGLPAWQALSDEHVGWLGPLPGDPVRALVTPKDDRTQPVLAGGLTGTDPLVDSLLDIGQARIGPASTTATFGPPQQLRGGWLKLRRDT